MSLTKLKIWPGISFSHGVPVPNYWYSPSPAWNTSRSLKTGWCTPVPRPVFPMIFPFASPESLLLSPARNFPLIFLYSAFRGNFHSTAWKKYLCRGRDIFPCRVVQYSFCYHNGFFQDQKGKFPKKSSNSVTIPSSGSFLHAANSHTEPYTYYFGILPDVSLLHSSFLSKEAASAKRR